MPLWSADKRLMPRSGDAILWRGDKKVLWRASPKEEFVVTNSMSPDVASRNAVARIAWHVIDKGWFYDLDKHIWREKRT